MAVRELELGGLTQTETPVAPRGLIGNIVHRLIYPLRRGKRPAPARAMGFYTDTTVCIGCKACEVACKQWNQLPADEFQWSGNSYDNTGELSAGSWRHVKFIEQFATPPAAAPPAPANGKISLDVVSAPAPESNRWLMMSDVCKHCVTAPCQQACPTGAIIYNEFGNVYIQPDICNGCAYCIAACPFGVITRSHFDGHTHKCTLCYDRQKDGLVPACAKACPTASIQFGPVDELRAKAAARVETLRAKGETRAHLYGAAATETYSDLNSFYLLVDRPEVYGLPASAVNPWIHMKGDYVRTVGAGLAALVVLLLTLFLTGR
ncbi:4Fe-4S dicluster domain-containing protein [Fimbriiglobus ruber]|uniref:Formate dehydrogenase O beta subunit n=1 Tax=Fimbriiglobus ruber TaxID=1908690 RepID=A0A225DPD5_9BACT|nr:4Fe-4S dicluster domain-containing protein [Fimbriiglobus ruber]OWK42933.1 Formate dehydrogenase O beta subunit [Fimbriiglobus ruber]